MLIEILQGYEELSRRAADIVARLVRSKQRAILGLATGTTPLGMYKDLIRLHTEDGLTFSHVITFNLDEYLGLPSNHPQSYHRYMHDNFFSHIDIRPSNTHIPNGRPNCDYEEYCQQYEDAIARAGGIDLQVVGIGRDGHIGFNEPTSSLGSRTRVKTLARKTVEDNSRFFDKGDVVPDCALTMGIGTILEAKRILLLASGRSKAIPVAKAVEGPVTASVTASALQLHRDVTILVDEDAAMELQHKDYYKRVADMTARVTPSRLW